jgi:predicted MFS family arabinose efflux permease
MSIEGATPNRSSGISSVRRHIFAGLSASLVSIGLARFAYTPLLPALIQAHWFAQSDVVYLGAANLAGYLVGALIGRPIAARVSNAHALRLMMALVTLSFLACAFPLSIAWFFIWRLVSGIAGGTIMVLVAATVLPHVPAERRGAASGAVFLGLGLGIAASGTIVPLLLAEGLRATWIGLALFSAVLTVASWNGWPAHSERDSRHVADQVQAKTGEHPPSLSAHARSVVNLLYIEYALMAVGLVAPMIFLVDFIARGLGEGAHFGALAWILYGVGAIVGPPAYGLLADRIGSRPALRVWLAIQVPVVAGLALSSNLILIGALTIIVGSFPPGIVPLWLARFRQTLAGNTALQNIVWSRATSIFAAAQAFSGYAYSAIFNHSGENHRLLFYIAAGAILIGLAADFTVPSRTRARLRDRQA